MPALAGMASTDSMVAHMVMGDQLVAMKHDLMALARLIRYSEEEALRLGLSGVVVECLRMAGIEIINAIEEESSSASEESPEPARAARMN
jgi:hypothetical protein